MVELSDKIKQLTPEKQRILEQELMKRGININKELNVFKQGELHIYPTTKEANYPLSYSQERMYMLSQMEFLNISYNTPIVFEVIGDLSITKIQEAFLKLLSRHEMLRTSFEIVEEKIVQIVHDNVEAKIEYIKLTNKDEVANPKIETMIDELIKPFDLRCAPLARLKVLEVTEKKYILFFECHHTISDATSMGILIREFADLYNGQLLPEIKVQYKDYVVWENKRLQNNDLHKQEKYWSSVFLGNLPRLDLPTDYDRTDKMDFGGRWYEFDLENEVLDSINRIIAQNHTTVFLFMLTTLNILLYKITGVPDIIIGFPVSNRNYVEVENMVGVFLNTLVLRNYPTPEKSFTQLLSEVTEHMTEAWENQDFQFEMLLEKIKYKREKGRNPLFDVAIDVLNMNNITEIPKISLDGLSVKPYKFKYPMTTFDFIMYIIEQDDKLRISCSYRTCLFKEETIAYLMNEFVKLIKQIITQPYKNIDEYKIFERKELFAKNSIFPKEVDMSAACGLNIVEDFQNVVRMYPNKVAVTDDKTILTYKQLNNIANVIQYNVEKVCKEGGGLKKHIALLLEQSSDMIACLIGGLKTGRIIIPIEPTYPIARLKAIVNNAEVQIIITNDKNIVLANEIGKKDDSCIEIINVSQLSDTNSNDSSNFIHSEQTALLLYTSGTTGIPKGVKQSYYNLQFYIKTYCQKLDINCKDKIGVLTSCTHAVGILDVLSGLLSGASLCIYDIKQSGRLDNLANWISKHKITIYHSVPSLYRSLCCQLLDDDAFSDIRLVILGGEAVVKTDFELYKKYCSDKCLFINFFGASEVMVGMFYILSKSSECPKGNIPIGYSVEGVEMLLLDQNNNEVSIYSIGEIVYRSKFISDGYWNLDDTTSEYFSYNELDSIREFRTGDLGRMLINGAIEYIGRKDTQVKIRGYRVELMEIERVIEEMLEIEQCKVLALPKQDGTICINAYYKVKDNIILENNIISERLRMKLPDYMLPENYVRISSFPLSPNGKLDRIALSKITSCEKKEDIIIPENEIEKRLLSIWRELLDVDDISITANFFDLGGHSLKATFLISSIYKEFGVELKLTDIFEMPTIKEEAAFILLLDTEVMPCLRTVDRNREFLLSPAQKRMFFLTQIEEKSTLYNIQIPLLIEGKLDISRVEKVLWMLIQRHESLRTSFVIRDNEILQIIKKVDEINTFHLELNYDLYEKSCTDEAVQETIARLIKPFELDNAPLIRCFILCLNENKNILVMDVHHIISDGTSAVILMEDFARLYNGKILCDEIIQYVDYSEFLTIYLQSEKAKKQLYYWKEIYHDTIPLLNLPTDYQRPQIKDFKGDIVYANIKKDLTKKLKRMALKTGTTLFMILLSAFYILLYKYSGQKDIVVGTPVSGRTHSGTERIVGIFINMLAIRYKLNSEDTYRNFLREVKKTCLNAFENQECQFENLVSEIEKKRDLSRNPLFDVVFIHQNIRHNTENIDNLKFAPLSFHNKTSEYDIKLESVELGDEIQLKMEYATSLFSSKSVTKMLKYYLKVLETIVSDIDISIRNIHLLNNSDMNEIMRMGKGKVNENELINIVSMIQKQCVQTPFQIALKYKDRELTYKELDVSSCALSNHLIGRNRSKGKIIALIVERSFDMFIGMIGIMKAGAAFLPIDPQIPKERIIYMLNDCSVQVIVTNIKLESEITNNREIVDLSQVLYDDDKSVYAEVPLPIDNPAYIIYTSGSTGEPKGVLVEHRAVANFFEAMKDEINFQEVSTILSITSLSFDISILENLLPLTLGMKIIIASEQQLRDVNLISKVIWENEVDIIQATPTRIRMLFSDVESGHELQSIKIFLIGGERLPKELVADIQKKSKAKIYNMYGPTETTIWSTMKEIATSDDVTIGKPVLNTNVYILDRDLNLLPLGCEGELFIGGSGVSKGYVNKKELTDSKFVKNPYVSDEIIYNTGDKVKWNNKGELVYIGRCDDQIKIRGYRIELSEVVKAIERVPEIKECVVVVSEKETEKILIAYYTGTKQLSMTYLKEYVKAILPDYMVPAIFVFLDNMPTTVNGKVDRKKLQLVELERPYMDNEFRAPKNEIEKKILNIWKQKLQIKDIGTEDNFFEVGGNSMLLVQVYQELCDLYPNKIKVIDLFNYPSVSMLAKFIQNGGRDSLLAREWKGILLSKEFWTNQEKQDERVVGFRLIPETVAKLKKYCKINNVVINDVCIFLYGYLLCQYARVKEVHFVVFEGVYGVPVHIFFDEHNNIIDTIQQLSSDIQYRKSKHLYTLDQIEDIRTSKEKNMIYVCYGLKNQKNYSGFDINLNVEIQDENIHGQIYLYNSQIKVDYIETFANDYIALLTAIAE